MEAALAVLRSGRLHRYDVGQGLPRTDRVLAGLLDMRLPLTFALEDCDLLAAHPAEAVNDVIGRE